MISQKYSLLNLIIFHLLLCLCVSVHVSTSERSMLSTWMTCERTTRTSYVSYDGRWRVLWRAVQSALMSLPTRLATPTSWRPRTGTWPAWTRPWRSRMTACTGGPHREPAGFTCNNLIIGNPNESHWPFLGSNSTCLGENHFKKSKIDNQNGKIRKTKISLLWIFVTSWCSLCFVLFCVCFCTGFFCHGGLELALSTLFTTFFSLNISSIYNIINALNECPSCDQFSDTVHWWALWFTHLMLVL